MTQIFGDFLEIIPYFKKSSDCDLLTLIFRFLWQQTFLFWLKFTIHYLAVSFVIIVMSQIPALF